jgi:GWxTD domain-containing protein
VTWIPNLRKMGLPFPQLRRLTWAGVAVASVLLSGARRARAQGTADSPVARANQLVSEAMQLAARGDTAAALSRLEQATRLHPTLADAHYRRGMLLARQAGNGLGDMFKRQAAGGALERALRIDRGNPNYYLELGLLRLKQGVQRIDAGRLFNRALRAARERGDPKLVAEVEAQLGDIDYRRYQAVGHRRLITGAGIRFDPEEAVANPHYARNFLADQSVEVEEAGELDIRQAEAHYRSGAAGWPAHDASNAGLLGILYDEGRYEEFREHARTFAGAAATQARSHLFLGLGLWRLGRAREAASAFDRGLALLTPEERGRLNNLSRILRRADAERYEALSAAQRAEFDRVYWSVNDPMKLTDENEHRLEYLARMAYADLRFSAPDLHLRGWDTDRGAIYIRYGPPPIVATFPPTTSPFADDPLSVGSITTVWFYPERNLRFVFYGPPGYNFARFAGEFAAYAEDARYATPVRYDNIPLAEALDSVSVQVASFRHPSDTTRTELVFFAGLPLTRMAEGVDLREGPIQNGLFVTDPLERAVVTQRRDERVQFTTEQHLERRTFTAAVPAGDYRYRVEARQPTTGRAARGAGPLAVEAFGRSALMVSDVIIADHVERRSDPPTGRADFLIDPNPAMRFAPGDAVHLYWEIYNLSPDSAGSVEYTAEVVLRIQSLERSGIVARAVGPVFDAMGLTAKGDEPISLRYDVSETEGGRDRVPAWVAVDLVDAPSGTYVLELGITDRVSGQTAVRRRTFTVTEQQP